MSIEQVDKIDFISTTSNGKVQLTISDHLEWNDEENHLLILQNKLNAYLSFIESGQILESYSTALNKDVIISIVMKYEPTENSSIFLNNCKNFLEKNGYEFKWEVLQDK